MKSLPLAFVFAMAVPTTLPNLQLPPVPPPINAPKLAPLLGDATAGLVTTRRAWHDERADLRTRWLAVLGALPVDRAPLNAKVLTTEELPTFTRQHLTYQIEDGVWTDGYLLTPKGVRGRVPAMVVFHPTIATHTAQVSGRDASEFDRMHGVHFVERGYLVWTPRCFIFDDRPDVTGGAVYTANVNTMQARHPHWTGMLRMTFDAMRAADFVTSLPNVDTRRVGAFGHSLGAKEALYAAAFDERYQVAVFSEGGIGLGFSNWEAVWYLGPQIKQPEFRREHHELLGLIAPRAFLLLAGNSADDDRSWSFIAAALPVYQLLGASDRIGWWNHGQGHRYSAEARAVTLAFVGKWLRAKTVR